MANNRINKTNDLILCGLFTALIAVGAFIRIPIPVTPFTLQFLFTNLAGILLGKRYGTVSVFIYVVIGLIGIPVFAGGGGIGYVLQPTFGYIIGFMFGAWVAGYIVDRRTERSLKTYLIAGAANLAIVYVFGMIYYYFIMNFYLNSPIGVGAIILYCFVLAVPGDIALCVLSAILAKRLHKVWKGRD